MICSIRAYLKNALRNVQTTATDEQYSLYLYKTQISRKDPYNEAPETCKPQNPQTI